MNKETIEKRLEELTAQRDQLLAQLNACEGAIMDCQYWLKLETTSPTDLSAKEEKANGKHSSAGTA